MTLAIISGNSSSQTEAKIDMKALFLILFLTASVSFAQDIEVTIVSDSAEYNKRFSSGSERYMKITTTFKNNTTQSVYLKTDRQFDLNYFGEGTNWGHCFRVYEYDKVNDSTFAYYKFHSYGSFVKIAPGEEFISNGYYSIGWLCRNAPPLGKWEFNVTYHYVLTAADNYSIEKSRYTDFTSKEFVDAWTGELRSNTIKITIN